MTGDFPVDWDGESYCVEPGCHTPATHRAPSGLTTDGIPIVVLVCCTHAHRPAPPPAASA